MSNTQRMSDEDFEAYETDDACGMLLMESVADKDNTIVELWGWMQAERAAVERVESLDVHEFHCYHPILSNRRFVELKDIQAAIHPPQEPKK